MLFNVVPLKILFIRKCPPSHCRFIMNKRTKLTSRKLHANMNLQGYLYPPSFVFQLLISQTWMSFKNDEYCDYRGKYDNGTKKFNFANNVEQKIKNC